MANQGEKRVLKKSAPPKSDKEKAASTNGECFFPIVFQYW